MLLLFPPRGPFAFMSFFSGYPHNKFTLRDGRVTRFVSWCSEPKIINYTGRWVDDGYIFGHIKSEFPFLLQKYWYLTGHSFPILFIMSSVNFQVFFLPVLLENILQHRCILTTLTSEKKVSLLPKSLNNLWYLSLYSKWSWNKKVFQEGFDHQRQIPLIEGFSLFTCPQGMILFS